MNREELALKVLEDELGDLPPTAENVLEASISAIRSTIYMDYNWAKPDVVEALLLNLRYVLEITFDEIDQAGDTLDEEKIVREILKFSFAMRKTIDKLYSV